MQPFDRFPLATASSDSDQRKLKIDVLLNHFRTGLVCAFIPFFFSKKGAAVAALIFAATASLGAATGENAETGGTGKADAAFDKTLGQLIGEPGGPPGAIAVVQRGHDVKVFRKGVADQKTGTPIHVGDRFRIGSVGKAFNGAVALQLVAQGKLSLSDTIGQRLPTLPWAWHNVTLGQLLNHTSGLPNFTNAPGWQRAAQEGEYLSPMDVIGLVSAQPLAFPPGSSYAYSNTDNIVVGLFAEMRPGCPTTYYSTSWSSIRCACAVPSCRLGSACKRRSSTVTTTTPPESEMTSPRRSTCRRCGRRERKSPRCST